MAAIFVVSLEDDLRIKPTPPVFGWTLDPGTLCNKPVIPIQIHAKFTGHESSPCHVIIILLLFLQDCTSHKMIRWQGFDDRETLSGSGAPKLN